VTITPEQRALLAQPSWTHDQLIAIAFLARLLLAELDAYRAQRSDIREAQP
jgi:hypothetical protein